MPNPKPSKAFAALIFAALLALASIACSTSSPASPAPIAAPDAATAPHPTPSATQPAAEPSAAPKPIAIATAEPTPMSAAPQTAPTPVAPAQARPASEDACPPPPDLSVSGYTSRDEPDFAPEDLPVARIIAKDAPHEAAAYGIPYYVSWDEDAPSEDILEEDVPEEENLLEMLPPPTELGPNPALQFQTHLRPRMMIVAGFDTLEPTDEADENACVWECLSCGTIGADGFLEFPKMYPQVFNHPYISVFAMWNTPPTLDNGEIVKYNRSASANWMFHVAAK